MSRFRSIVEKFLAEQGVSATRFGREAVGDEHFIHELREGRRVGPEIQAKVRLYMDTTPRRKAAA